MIILEAIEPAVDPAALARQLRVDSSRTHEVDRFSTLVKEAVSVARPKGVYRTVECEVQGEDSILIDGVRLHSRVLAVHLAEAHRAFPFVATCGHEVTDWAAAHTDLLERFWLESILDSLLQTAIVRTREHMVTAWDLTKVAQMSPGSLDDWPIGEQRPLFAILGDIEAAIGVRLRESLMMEPPHSVSGIVFPTQVDFTTCMLCPRRDCPKRRSPYDKALYSERYDAHRC